MPPENVKVTIPETLKDRVTRVKKHLQTNRNAYLAGGSCLAAGYFLRHPGIAVTNFVINEAPKFAPDSASDMNGCIWIADHVMDKINRVGMSEVTMESGEIIELVKKGMK